MWIILQHSSLLCFHFGQLPFDAFPRGHVWRIDHQLFIAGSTLCTTTFGGALCGRHARGERGGANASL
jgi:hypothetical protein